MQQFSFLDDGEIDKRRTDGCTMTIALLTIVKRANNYYANMLGSNLYIGVTDHLQIARTLYKSFHVMGILFVNMDETCQLL